jgi:hypothetical protein
MKSKKAAVQRIVQKVAVFLAVILAMPASATWATNYSFTPGDAFFSTTLTQKVVDAFPLGDEPVEFQYLYPSSGHVRGFAGFHVLRLEGKTSVIKSRMAVAYRELRESFPATYSTIKEEDGKERKFEDNGFAVYIYNRGIDWTKQRLAIRYNENWFSPPESALREVGRNDYNPRYPRGRLEIFDSLSWAARRRAWQRRLGGVRGAFENACASESSGRAVHYRCARLGATQDRAFRAGGRKHLRDGGCQRHQHGFLG